MPRYPTILNIIKHIKKNRHKKNIGIKKKPLKKVKIRHEN